MSQNVDSNQNSSKTNESSISIQKFKSEDFYTITKEAVPFTQLCNYVIQNIKNRDAGMLWVYMSSLPPNWNINKHQLAKHFDVSIKSIERWLSYLKECQLIHQVQTRNENGTLSVTKIYILNGSEYQIFEEIEPCDKKNQPCDKFGGTVTNPPKSRGSTVRQITVDGVLSNIQINRNTKKKKETTTSSSSSNNVVEIKTEIKKESSSSFSLKEKIEELADLQISRHGLIDATKAVLIKQMENHVNDNIKAGRAKDEESACKGLLVIISKTGGFKFDTKNEAKVVIQKTCEEIALEIEKENERRKEYNRKVNEFKSKPENVNVVENEFQQMRKALGMKK